VQSEVADGLAVYDPPTNAEMEARTILSANYATSAVVAAIAAVLTGITSLANWLRALARSSPADVTALAEINSGGGTYNPVSDALEVENGTIGSVTYTISNINIDPPAALELTTGYLLCLGTDGLPEAGVAIWCKMVEGPGTDGYGLDTAAFAVTSGLDGIAQHTGFVRGATYRFKRGIGNWSEAFTAPDAETWALNEILGPDS
jgi:hypothetical protein